MADSDKLISLNSILEHIRTHLMEWGNDATGGKIYSNSTGYLWGVIAETASQDYYLRVNSNYFTFSNKIAESSTIDDTWKINTNNIVTSATAPLSIATTTSSGVITGAKISISAATASAAGSMSSADKTKLDKISVGADSATLGDSVTTALAIWGNSTNKVAISATNSSSGDGHRYAIRAQSDGIQLYDYSSGTSGSAVYKIYPTSGTSPISVSNGVISISAASTTAAGAMSAADKTKLNSLPSSISGTAPISVSNAGVVSISAATTSAAGSMSAADKTKLDKFTTSLATVSVGSASTAASNISFWRGFDDSNLGDYFAIGSQNSDGTDGFRIYLGQNYLSFRTFVGSTGGDYALRLYSSYYQTNNSADITLNSGTITKVTLTSTNVVTYGPSYYSISSGGIKVSKAGIYKISASVYINSNSGQTSRSVYVYAGTSTTMTNNTQILEADYAGSLGGAIPAASKIVELSANAIVFLGARSNGAASSVPASHIGTYLFIQRLT